MKNLSTLSPRLRENQAKSIRVVLTPQLSKEVIEEWIGALEVNESLTNVQVVGCGNFASHKHWKSLLLALLSLPRLQHFQLRGPSHLQGAEEDVCIVPVSLFADLPLRSQELQSLSLAHLVLEAQGPRDFQAMSHWLLKAQKALQSFQLIGVGLEQQQLQEDDIMEDESAAAQEDDSLTTSALEPLLTTLESFPRLGNLEISGTVTPLGVVEQLPTGLFQSKSLQRLSISDFILSPTALSSLFTSTTSIPELAISGDLTQQVAPRLSRFFQNNHQTLDAIALRLDSLQDEIVNQEVIRAIGSSSLKVVSLCSFYGGALSMTSRKAVADMLRKNCNLEYLYVPCPNTDTVFWEQVQLYLGLNAAGRKQILSHDDGPLKTGEKQATTCRAEQRLELVRSEIHNVFEFLKTTTGPGNISSEAKSVPSKKLPAVTRVTLQSTLKTSSLKFMAASSCTSGKKRHEHLVHKARTAKKRKHQSYVAHSAVVPTKGLSSMFITRS
ncbi:expressed unknown protein [Seminavis robusta]|uniref:Uncharacterized protein n=1 Tax=Seminavis robusta TaxID=568900 RepID=A0A9N8EFB1_9STRA|nr:expressed unknown protein [Seminavis robusta]|eukprot:Sro1105_g241910.1 n/a (497) ;mRNA; f:13937-15427